MRKSLWNAASRKELTERLDRLEPGATPRWGRMTAPQMLAHITDWMAMAAGDLSALRKPGILHQPLVRKVAIYWLPFPKGVPTAKELITREASDWPAEIASFRRYLDTYVAVDPNRVWPEHPAFGFLSTDAWGVLGYRHADHHLRQFGV
jgi:hypothetical protein